MSQISDDFVPTSCAEDCMSSIAVELIFRSDRVCVKKAHRRCGYDCAKVQVLLRKDSGRRQLSMLK